MNHNALHLTSFFLALGRVVLVGALLGLGLILMPTAPATDPAAVVTSHP
jgi:hypothetical protein